MRIGIQIVVLLKAGDVGPIGDTVLRILMIVSLLATVNALQRIASLVPYAMSRDHMLPPLLQRVNPGGTPVPALIAGTCIALAFLATGTFNSVLALMAFFFVAMYAMVFTALFVKRRRAPAARRPFRVPLYPWVPAIALIGSLLFLAGAIWSDPRNSLIALTMLALTWPIYLAQRWWLKPPTP